MIGSLESATPDPEPEWDLLLAQALIKSDKFELVLQKATELGVSGILPLETKYAAIRIPAGKMEQKLERWRRIVREASRQCGRSRVPEVASPVPFSRFASSPDQVRPVRLFFHAGADAGWDAAAVPAGGTVVCIGPEGGWHEDEAKLAQSSGFLMFHLGPRILRAETAAIAALALAQFRIANSSTPVDNVSCRRAANHNS